MGRTKGWLTLTIRSGTLWVRLGGEYGGNKLGVFTDFSGVAMLSDKVPTTLGSGGNVTRNGGVVIQNDKFI